MTTPKCDATAEIDDRVRAIADAELPTIVTVADAIDLVTRKIGTRHARQ